MDKKDKWLLILLVVMFFGICLVYFTSYVPVHYICENELGRSDLFTHTTRLELLLGLKSGHIYTIVNNNGTHYVYGYTYETHQEECFRS